jgi:hypothetical protein
VTHAAAVWIAALIRQFPELLHELIPGSRAPYPTDRPEPGPRALAAQAARHRDERADALRAAQHHGSTPIGGGSAPLRLFVSDTIRDLTDSVVELEEAVRERLALRPVPPAPVTVRLRRIAGLLDRVAADPDLAAHVLDETRRMARRCSRALGDSEQIVRADGRCPWCDSLSLRAFPERAQVLCINPACRCDTADCPCGDDAAYRHCWDESESPARSDGPARKGTSS